MTNITPVNTKNFSTRARSFVKNLGNPDAYLPVILLEATVTTGRTYQAYKRGGFVEARERGTEETSGAVFWLGGVYAFNKMGDAIGRKVLKLDTAQFEIGSDRLRNPIENFLKTTPKHITKNKLAAFKFTKIISSILLADTFIGLVVPKVNQAITRKYQKSVKDKQKQQNPADVNKNIDKRKTSFSGLMNPQKLINLTQNFENDAKYKLISTDAGTVSGRAYNARNKYEREEILFRDITSIYFYYFCKNNLNSVLNYAEDGRTTRLDTVSAKTLDEHLKANLDANRTYSIEEFKAAVMGGKAELPEVIDKKFDEKGIIKLDDLLAELKDEKIKARATKMSELQPKMQGVSILSKEQVKDVFKNGLLDEPEFLNKIFRDFTEEKSVKEFMFVSEKELEKLKQNMVDYIEDIAKRAKKKGSGITFETLTKACKSNMIKNSVNLGAGFAVSALFLSTLIPKAQYWITRKRTGQNKFPGTEEFDKNKTAA
jgi:hypothetical protein